MIKEFKAKLIEIISTTTELYTILDILEKDKKPKYEMKDNLIILNIKENK